MSYKILFGDSARPADDPFYALLTSLEVEENADLPGAIQLTLPINTQGATGSEDLTVVGDDRFKPYARIAVVVSVDGKPDACIFDGYILSHRAHLDRGTSSASVQIWGQDASCLMNLEEKVKEWTESDGTIANTIFQYPEYKFSTASENTQDDSGDHPPSRHTVMQRGTDAQFLRDRARRAGKLFRVCCESTAGRITGYFIKPKLEGTPVNKLVLNARANVRSNIASLDFSWDVGRPTEVKAKALARTKDPLDGNTGDAGMRVLDSRSLAAFTGSHVTKVMLTTAVGDASELQQRARSILREASWFVTCEGEVDIAQLRAVLRVATVVEIEGAGRLNSGNYFVWSVRHTFTADSHRMKFVLVRNAVGAA